MAEPLILAIDTSHMKGSVAVARGPEILCEIVFDASDTHSATLMPAVDACLGGAHAKIDEIDLFAVVSGPGSFTGLRIGLASVKAFAAVKRRGVASVTSLRVLAAAFPYSSLPVLPMIDARRGEVYAGLYETSAGSPRELVAPCAVKPGDVTGILSQDPVIVCGTGGLRYRDLLKSVLPDGSHFAHPRWAVPSASLLAVLAREGDPIPYEELPALEPLYLRPPDARLPRDTALRDGGGR
jgi:tRNA threonylcarbamoyladenosine biosynthesis protein TsaB